jgi:hypothetical protein
MVTLQSVHLCFDAICHYGLECAISAAKNGKVFHGLAKALYAVCPENGHPPRVAVTTAVTESWRV